MHILNDASRRLFLRRAGAMSALVGSAAAPTALNLAALGSAAAQATGEYRALVCLFFFGGNDSFNMVLPTDCQATAAQVMASARATPATIAGQPSKITARISSGGMENRLAQTT